LGQNKKPGFFRERPHQHDAAFECSVAQTRLFAA
jgi:hypothetical protein